MKRLFFAICLLPLSAHAEIGWQIHRLNAQGAWEPFLSPRGHIAKVLSSQSACLLDLASARMVYLGVTLDCKPAATGR